MSLDLDFPSSIQLAPAPTDSSPPRLSSIPKISHNSSDISSSRQPSQPGTALQKFKTELCKNYSQKGRCPYNAKCRFAHGEHQLQTNCLHPNKNFKTRKCKSYWREGSCSYGLRCQFEHWTPSASQTTLYLHIWSELLSPCWRGEGSRLLLIISQLSPALSGK